MSERGKWFLVAFCALMFLVSLLTNLTPAKEPVVVQTPPSLASSVPPVSTSGNFAHQMNDILADVVARVKPSVVVIRTEKVGYKIHTDLLGNPWYRELQNLTGEGSGVIIDSHGYVLTSWHVLKGAMAQRIEVVFDDGSKLPARYVGHDEATDLAVLRIVGDEASVYPTVEVGDSEQLRVGHMVVAVGAPYSLQSSVAMGHVSQKGRHLKVIPYEDFIQTDIALNKGNSGGPLVDVDGKLVGINAAILGEGTGIAFSVPSNVAVRVAKSLIENGKHEWPWVGAIFSKGSAESDLLQVSKVYVDTPAAKAGVQPGDVVLAVNDKSVRSPDDVLREIFNYSVGEQVRFSLQRTNGEPYSIELSLEQFPGRIN